VDVTHAALQEAAGDKAELSDLLDAVAAEAASGSPDAIEMLVWAIDEFALARPAIRRVVINESDVDDIGQDVLVAVASTVSSFRGDARFTTWLNRVARYKAIDHLRRKRDEARLDDVPPGDAGRISSLLTTRADLQRALQELPEHYRDAVVLCDMQQLSYDEVARRLGLNLNTTKSRIARGRALLAAIVSGR
jgi:RNA polymerase sigma-70 factor (ECF subfamily)